MPYLFHRSRNNRRDKLRSKFLREKNVQKTTFEAAEMRLGPWNQQRRDLRRTVVKFYNCPNVGRADRSGTNTNTRISIHSSFIYTSRAFTNIS